MTRHLVLVLAIAVSLVACHSEPPQPAIPPPSMPPPSKAPASAAAPPAAQAESPHRALHWSDPSGWTREQPKSSMRQAQYAVPKAPGDPEDGELVVFYFGPGQGGSVEDNFTRWEGQFTQPDGKASHDVAKTEKRDVKGVPVSVVSLQGTYAGGGMMPGEPATSKEHWALLGAIAETPDGPWFFKMTGPAATVTRARAAFDTLVSSMQLAPAH